MAHLIAADHVARRARRCRRRIASVTTPGRAGSSSAQRRRARTLEARRREDGDDAADGLVVRETLDREVLRDDVLADLGQPELTPARLGARVRRGASAG